MSPVAPSGSNHVGRAALVSLVGIIVLFAGLWLVTITLGNRNSPDLSLGDQTFKAGNAERLAATIEKSGPILFGDVSGRRDRDVILQHLGTDPKTGWHAFLAAPPDKARDCTWEWQPKANNFRARCDHSRTALADGTGLTQFDVKVGNGIEIDLNAEARAKYQADKKPTTTAGPTTTPR